MSSADLPSCDLEISTEHAITASEKSPLEERTDCENSPTQATDERSELTDSSSIDIARGQNVACSNCQTTTTPLWRRNEKGNRICNACGLYFKLHNIHRPKTLVSTVIRKRRRSAAFKPAFPKASRWHMYSAPSVAPFSKEIVPAELYEQFSTYGFYPGFDVRSLMGDYNAETWDLLNSSKFAPTRPMMDTSRFFPMA